MRSPICAWSISRRTILLRTHHQHAAARPRRCDPAIAAAACATAQHPAARGGAPLERNEEMKPKPRSALRDIVTMFDRWRVQMDSLPHTELAEIVLDESGYTEMWQKDRSADAAGRLEI